MALGLTQVDSLASTTDGTSFLGTASITPTADRLCIVSLVWSKATTPDLPTSVAGYGLTFTRVDDQTFSTVGTPVKRCATYWADTGAAPTNAQLTITFSATQTGCWLDVVTIAGALRGFNYSAGNKAKNAGDSIAAAGTLTATLAALHTDGRNGVWIVAGSSTNNAALDPEASWTQNRDSGYGTPTTGSYTGYRLGTTDNTATVTIATATKNVGMVAFEIQAARSLPLPARRRHPFLYVPDWWTP